jgi:ribonuclease HI
MVFYAVVRGRRSGVITSDNGEFTSLVKGYPGCIYKCFQDITNASAYMNVAKSYVTETEDGAHLIANCTGVCFKAKSEFRAGVGVRWTRRSSRCPMAGLGSVADRVPSHQSSDRADLISVVRVLEQCPSYPCFLLVKTDSAYAIECVVNAMIYNPVGIRNWKIIEYIVALIKERERRYGWPVKFMYVDGDVDAYRLAVKGSEQGPSVDPSWSWLIDSANRRGR